VLVWTLGPPGHHPIACGPEAGKGEARALSQMRSFGPLICQQPQALRVRVLAAGWPGRAEDLDR